VNGRVIVKTLS